MPGMAKDIELSVDLVLVDDKSTKDIDEAQEILDALEYWRLNQITGLTQDGEKILEFTSINDVLVEELTRYISVILTGLCDTKLEKCPASLRDDYILVQEASKTRKRNTKNAIKRAKVNKADRGNR